MGISLRDATKDHALWNSFTGNRCNYHSGYHDTRKFHCKKRISYAKMDNNEEEGFTLDKVSEVYCSEDSESIGKHPLHQLFIVAIIAFLNQLRDWEYDEDAYKL